MGIGGGVMKCVLVLSLAVALLAVAPIWSLDSEVVPLSADDVALSDDGTARTEGTDSSERSIFAALDKATGIHRGAGSTARVQGELGDMKTVKKAAKSTHAKKGAGNTPVKKKATANTKKSAAKAPVKKKVTAPKKQTGKTVKAKAPTKKKVTSKKAAKKGTAPAKKKGVPKKVKKASKGVAKKVKKASKGVPTKVKKASKGVPKKVTASKH